MGQTHYKNSLPFLAYGFDQLFIDSEHYTLRHFGIQVASTILIKNRHCWDNKPHRSSNNCGQGMRVNILVFQLKDYSPSQGHLHDWKLVQKRVGGRLRFLRFRFSVTRKSHQAKMFTLSSNIPTLSALFLLFLSSYLFFDFSLHI